MGSLQAARPRPGAGLRGGGGSQLPRALPAHSSGKCGRCPRPRAGSFPGVPVIDSWRKIKIVPKRSFPNFSRQLLFAPEQFDPNHFLGEPGPLSPCLSDCHFGNWRKWRCLQRFFLLPSAPAPPPEPRGPLSLAAREPAALPRPLAPTRASCPPISTSANASQRPQTSHRMLGCLGGCARCPRT